MSRVTYTVQENDTLGKIAREVLGDGLEWPVLADYNQLDNPHLLQVGQVLEIPPWLPRRFRFPLAEKETSYFKFGDLYPSSSKWAGKPHPGVDFHETSGARVYAVGEGKVVRRGCDPYGYGHYTLLEHRLPDNSPIWSLYAHLGIPANYSAGTWITGQSIGIEGDTGASGGLPHVHLEIKKTTDLATYPLLTVDNLRKLYVDPYFFLSNALFLPIHCWGCTHRGKSRCS